MGKACALRKRHYASLTAAPRAPRSIPDMSDIRDSADVQIDHYEIQLLQLCEQ